MENQVEVEAEIAKQVAKTSLLTIQRLVKTMNLHMKMLRTKQKVFKLIPRHISLDLQHFRFQMNQIHSYSTSEISMPSTLVLN